jgi:hypothetical protein
VCYLYVHEDDMMVFRVKQVLESSKSTIDLHEKIFLEQLV